MQDHNLLVVLGPTASGKTRLAVQLAKHFHGEIISADSRQVYRGLDIGSGKDLEEYGDVPYHLIDIVDPGYEFSVYDFQQRFLEVFCRLSTKPDTLPILAGGTGLYLNAALKGYRLIPVPENPELRQQLAKNSDTELVQHLKQLKPNTHNSTDLLDRNRTLRAIEIAEGEQSAQASMTPLPAITPFIFGIHWDRTALRQRITTRLKERLSNGLIEEVESLHSSGVSWATFNFYGLEYRFVSQYLQGQLNRNDLFQKLNSAIHQFAKKQDTWFRRMERDGLKIHWLEGAGDVVSQALSYCSTTQNSIT